MSETQGQNQESDDGTQLNVTVEYVCTANGGRSPMAEEEAEAYVAALGLEGRINVESSGSDAKTWAHDFMSANPDDLVGAIEAGLKEGTYQGKAKAIAEQIVKNKDVYKAMLVLGDIRTRTEIESSVRYLIAGEEAYRNLALLEDGISPKGNYHKQTVARPGVDVILTMKQKNADQVSKIYEGSGYDPVISPLCQYAGLSGDIPDPFGKGMDGFRESRDAIKKAVHGSIDRIAREYLK